MNIFNRISCLVFLILGVQRGFSDDGDWNTDLANCGDVEEIPGDTRTKVPWVAGIFVRNSASTQYRLFVTGTIIGPSAILTVLGGAFGQTSNNGRKYSVPDSKQHIVAVGLDSSDLRDRDEHTQIVEVSNAIPYTLHEPHNRQYHLFMFQLKTPLNLSTPYARAACFPSNSEVIEGEDYTDAWASFVVAGDFIGPKNDQSGGSKNLMGVNMLLDKNTVCEREFKKRYGRSPKDDIYCGRLALGLRQEPLCPSYGTAAVGFNFGRWYMFGILALHERGRSWCGPSSVFFFSRIVKPWQWLFDFQGSSGDRFPCGYGLSIGQDQVCDQKSDCDDDRDEDPIYCRGRRPCIGPRRSFECGVYGPCLNPKVACDGTKDCSNGEDEDPKNCPLNPTELTATGSHQCGTIDTSSLQPLIVGGHVTSRTNSFPWHASIFRTNGKSSKYICGGSLIEKNILVTAAHCVDHSPGRPQTELLRVVLGANSSDYNSIVLTSTTAQIFQVIKVWVPQTYDTLTLTSDIALLQLDHDAVFDPYVRPVCYRSSGLAKNVPPPGTVGKVPGYGLTEEGNVSEYLRYLDYPVVSTFECLSSLKHAPPISTFCAGYKNGSSVCQGDSGGGLVFPQRIGGTERYVLKGLVSRGNLVARKACNAFNYAVFTHVDAYSDWITSTLKSL